MKRIGILGGTFDPIHYGHIRPALEVKQALKLDKIWLMPNHIPPHKHRAVTSSEHRLNMVKLVCDEYSDFELCDIEIQRDTPSYTVTTLQALAQRYPDIHFTFLMGMDSLLSLTKWYQWQKLFQHCDIAVSHRPGYQMPSRCEVAAIYQQHLANVDQATQARKGRIFDIEIQPQNISSTDIRQAMNSKQSNNVVMLDSVAAYIDQHELY